LLKYWKLNINKKSAKKGAEMDLSGKKAVIFGGTSGIGLATTLLLAENGAEVTAISREPKKA